MGLQDDVVVPGSGVEARQNGFHPLELIGAGNTRGNAFDNGIKRNVGQDGRFELTDEPGGGGGFAANPAKKHTRTMSAKAMRLTTKIPPIEPNGISGAKGLARFFMIAKALPMMMSRMITGTRKMMPPNIVVFRKPKKRFILSPNERSNPEIFAAKVLAQQNRISPGSSDGPPTVHAQPKRHCQI